MTLKERRYEKGLTQAELAKLAEVDKANISRYETGNGRPGPKAAKKLADAFGCTVKELMRGFEEKTG